MDSAIERALTAMRRNLAEPITIDDLARIAMLSKFHFTRLFQKATGVSPGRFLSAMRLQEAKHLLVTTSMNVAEISYQVGYTSVGTFTTRFRESVGISPTHYRRRRGYAGTVVANGPEPGTRGATVVSVVHGP